MKLTFTDTNGKKIEVVESFINNRPNFVSEADVWFTLDDPELEQLKKIDSFDEVIITETREDAQIKYQVLGIFENYLYLKEISHEVS